MLLLLLCVEAFLIVKRWYFRRIPRRSVVVRPTRSTNSSATAHVLREMPGANLQTTVRNWVLWIVDFIIDLWSNSKLRGISDALKGQRLTKENRSMQKSAHPADDSHPSLATPVTTENSDIEDIATPDASSFSSSYSFQHNINKRELLCDSDTLYGWSLSEDRFQTPRPRKVNYTLGRFTIQDADSVDPNKTPKPSKSRQDMFFPNFNYSEKDSIEAPKPLTIINQQTITKLEVLALRHLENKAL